MMRADIEMIKTNAARQAAKARLLMDDSSSWRFAAAISYGDNEPPDTQQ